ncbi:Lrp/AsnC ligand binding domain-containing protein [Haloplanus sp. GCM10025708]|uniref:Lrp/AsnC ligand binding domain-containing protein n=1 Tax=Haloferacaceae TaxID=1644056 RepID=UPI0036123AA6
MVHAFIMVKTGAGESETLLSDVDGIEDVTEAHVVAGDYDIIAEVDAPEVYDVLHVAASGIQSLAGVLDTRTYVAMDD